MLSEADGILLSNLSCKTHFLRAEPDPVTCDTLVMTVVVADLQVLLEVALGVLETVPSLRRDDAATLRANGDLGA